MKLKNYCSRKQYPSNAAPLQDFSLRLIDLRIRDAWPFCLHPTPVGGQELERQQASLEVAEAIRVANIDRMPSGFRVAGTTLMITILMFMIV